MCFFFLLTAPEVGHIWTGCPSLQPPRGPSPARRCLEPPVSSCKKKTNFWSFPFKPIRFFLLNKKKRQIDTCSPSRTSLLRFSEGCLSRGWFSTECFLTLPWASSRTLTYNDLCRRKMHCFRKKKWYFMLTMSHFFPQSLRYGCEKAELDLEATYFS